MAERHGAAGDIQGEGAGDLFGRAGPLVVARLVVAVLSIAVPLVLARAMQLVDYGTYKQLFLIVQTLYFLLSFGIVQSLFFFIPRADQPRAWFVQTLVLMAMASLVGAAVVLGLAEPVARWFGNPRLLEHRWAMAIYLAGILGSYPLEAGLTARGRTREAAVIYVVSDALRGLVLVVPVLLGFGLHGMTVAAAGYGLLRLAATWALLAPGEGPLFAPGLLRRQLGYALPFGVAVVLSTAQQYGHQFAVSASVPPELFAIYTVGFLQLPFIDLLYSPVSEMLMVRVGEDEKTGRTDRSLEAFRESSAMLAFAFLPLVAFLIAAAPDFIGALYGAKFLDAVPLFRVGLLGVVLAAVPVDAVLRARNQTRHLMRSYFVKALCTVPLVWFGVRHFSMMGGIGSWVLAEYIGAAVLLVKLPAALSTPGHRRTLREVLPWRAWGKAALAALAAALGVVAVRAMTGDSARGLPPGPAWRLLPLAITGLLFASAYLTALRASGVNPLRLVEAFRGARAAR